MQIVGWLVGWFLSLTRAYDNIGRCPRQKLVVGIFQLSQIVVRSRKIYTANDRLEKGV